jgi:hypothetical protein
MLAFNFLRNSRRARVPIPNRMNDSAVLVLYGFLVGEIGGSGLVYL